MKCVSVKAMVYSLQRYLRMTWGLDYKTLQLYYIAVIIPTMLYGVSVWVSALKFKWCKNMLRAVQRLVSKSMVRSFKSASTSALIVLSNTLPIELKAFEIATTRILSMQDNILSPSSKKVINWVINIMGNGWVVEKETNYHSSAYPPWSSPTIPLLIHLTSDATSHEQALREKPYVKAYIDGSAGNPVNIICCFQEGQSSFTSKLFLTTQLHFRLSALP